MPLILGTNSIKDTGYDVANSLRFDDGSSDYLSRTTGTPTSDKIGTLSFWVKRTRLGSPDNYIFNNYINASNYSMLRFDGADRLEFFSFNDPNYLSLRTNRLFRDTSAWYHIVFKVDMTQATSSNRLKFYVNGVEETSFSSTEYGTQNQVCNLFTSSASGNNRIGTDETSTYHIDGYMAEVCLIDGQALDPTSFGEFDEDSPTIWKPKDVSDLTFGTNGFYLDFENASSLGADVSGNSNNFTVNNLTSIDQSTDTCTNNFATLNPLVPTSSATFSEGNLKITGSSSSAYSNRSQSTFAVESGKWYFEVEADAVGGSNPTIGIGRSDRSASDNPTGSNAGDVCIRLDNEKYDEGSASASYFSSSISNGNIIGVALDMDNGKIWFSLQGTFVGTVGSSGEAATFTVGNGITITPTLRPMDGTLICNFGSPPYAISSGNSDGNGYGNFEYSVPSGYYSLNSKNLAEFG
jgi:hypothetical protein